MPEADRSLVEYLDARLPGEVTGTQVLSDGLNRVLSVATAADETAYVLREPTALRDTEPFNDVRAEYRLLQRLRETPVPAPEPVRLCEDAAVLDRPFVVLEHLPGEVLPRGSPLPERWQSPAAHRTVVEGLVNTLATLHGIDPEPYADVCEHLTPLAQVERAADRLAAAADAVEADFPVCRRVADWLRENAPEPPRTALLHGDYREGNVLVDGEEPRLTGVIDWETALLGDPLTELGYLLLDWEASREPLPDPEPVLARYPDHAGHADVRRLRWDGLWPPTTEPGCPDRQAVVERYEAATGLAFEHDRFYRALGAFLMATVWADLHRRDRERGTDTGFAPMAAYMGRVAERIADGAHPL